MKKIFTLLTLSLLASIAFTAKPAEAKTNPSYSTPPIYPFDSMGYCFHKGCPSLYLRARVSSINLYVNSSNTIPATIQAPVYLTYLSVGIDNEGYSNFWEAEGFLVSSNGARIGIGKANARDGNKYESIGVGCEPKYNYNKCYPSLTWSRIEIPTNTETGVYSLEVQFFLYNGSFDRTYTFGPNFLTVNGITPITTTTTTSTTLAPTPTTLTEPMVVQDLLNGKRCRKLGDKTQLSGMRYACLKIGKKLLWQRLS